MDSSPLLADSLDDAQTEAFAAQLRRRRGLRPLIAACAVGLTLLAGFGLSALGRDPVKPVPPATASVVQVAAPGDALAIGPPPPPHASPAPPSATEPTTTRTLRPGAPSRQGRSNAPSSLRHALSGAGETQIPKVRGLDPSTVARVIARDQRGRVQLCFERELKRQPQLRGTVLLEVDVAPPRKVVSLTVQDSLKRPRFTRCVRHALKRLRLPHVREEASLQIPFALASPTL